jgi:hypothetical protein
MVGASLIACDLKFRADPDAGAAEQDSVPEPERVSRCCDGECCPLGAACVGGECPLADLVVHEDGLRETLLLDQGEFAKDHCAVQAGCTEAGDRRLLRFSLVTVNRGEGDFYLGVQGESEAYDRFDECYQSWHVTDFARFRLLDARGRRVAAGAKAAACIADIQQVDPDAGPYRHRSCREQGLSPGWADVYRSTLDCQWVDVTEVRPGTYDIEVTTNADRRFAESDYDNNTVTVEVEIP